MSVASMEVLQAREPKNMIEQTLDLNIEPSSASRVYVMLILSYTMPYSGTGRVDEIYWHLQAYLENEESDVVDACLISIN